VIVKLIAIALPEGIVSRDMKEYLATHHLLPQIWVVQVTFNNLYLQTLQVIKTASRTNQRPYFIALL
jgi:hypothetical protein